MTDFTTNFNTIQFDGASFLIGAETVNVLWRNSDGDIFLASGTTVPTNATAGYAKGAMFFDTDATSTGSVFWVNEGSATSSKFVSVTAPTTITLAGDVTGDSDSNTVAKINGVALGTTTATSGNVLTANGTNWATATPDGAGLVDKASAQTITGVKTIGTDKKLQFRDTGLYINSSADGQLDIVADTTLAITAPATTASGSLALATDKKLQFRDSALTISSTTDGQLDIAADTKLQLTSATTAVSDALSLAGDTTVATDKKMQFRDTGLYINSSADGQLDIAADGVVKITTPSTINTGVLNYAETAGTAPAYTLAVSITALVDGAMIMFKTNGASTDDDATINVNSLGAKPLCKASTGAQITDAGVLVDNGVYIAIYSTDVVVDGGWMVQGV